ncbi:hypothetical protein Tco_0288239, partial [Tanacetum coccineum]
MNYIHVSVENQVTVNACTQDSFVAVEDVPPAAHEKPSERSPKENDVQDLEDTANKETFEEEKRRIASQKKAVQDTSTKKLSTDRPSISTDSPSMSTDRPSVSTNRSYVSAAR